MRVYVRPVGSVFEVVREGHRRGPITHTQEDGVRIARDRIRDEGDGSGLISVLNTAGKIARQIDVVDRSECPVCSMEVGSDGCDEGEGQ